MNMGDDFTKICRRTALRLALGAGGAVVGAARGYAESPKASRPLPTLLTHAKLGGLALVATEKGRLIENILTGAASPAFGIPVKNNTLFHVGSVGKHVTAVALLRLAEQGKLDLD